MAISLVAASTEYFDEASAPVSYPCTISIWCTATGTNNIIAGQANSASSKDVFAVGTSSTGTTVDALSRGAGSFSVATTGNNRVAGWNHYCGTFPATGNQRIVLNGDWANSGTSAVETPTGQDRFRIGSWGDSSPNGWVDGDVAEMAAWSVELNQVEIEALAAGVSPLLIRPASLVRYVPMRLYASTIYDLTSGAAYTEGGTPTQAAEHPPVFMGRPIIIRGAAGGATAYTLTAEAGSFALSGTDAALEYGRSLTADAGSFALSGTDAALEYGYSLTAESGSFALSGADAALEYGYALSAEAGSFTVSGTDATLTYSGASRSITAEAGSFALTGATANLEYGYALTAEVGSFALSGQDATLNKGFTLNVEAGSFSISGTNASLEFGYLLDAQAGSFAISGQSATLTYSGDVVEETQAEVWWPIVLREREREDRKRKIAAQKIAKAKKSAKRKITLHIREGKPVTESALLNLVKASVKTAAPKAPADDREDAAISIMIDLAAHIARVADEEDVAALLLA